MPPAASGAAASAMMASAPASARRKTTPSIQPVSRVRVGVSASGRIGPRRSLRAVSGGGSLAVLAWGVPSEAAGAPKGSGVPAWDSSPARLTMSDMLGRD